MGAVYRYGPPPGLLVPEYSRAESSLVSIHAIPARQVLPGGTSVVSYTAETPFTGRPAGCQVPSLANARLPNGASAAGSGSADLDVATTRELTACSDRTVRGLAVAAACEGGPAAGAPPLHAATAHNMTGANRKTMIPAPARVRTLVTSPR